VIELHHLFGLERERIEGRDPPAVDRALAGRVRRRLGDRADGAARHAPADPLRAAPPRPAPSALIGFDLTSFRQLSFEAVDRARFPALELGYRCIEQGADSGTVLNAADEVAVESFLNSEISLADIARVNARVLERRPGLARGIDDLLRADGRARELAREEIRRSAAVTPQRTNP
jgi:1-deoxy-D-xylulose-5-phosphate reductoisomerase